MTAVSKRPADARPVRYDPVTGELLDRPIWSGRRRAFERRECLPWRYPIAGSRREQYASFEAWQPIAMQILHSANASFRCIAVFRSLFRWSNGTIETSYAEIARRGGGCSEKTVQRELAVYERVGIIIVEHGWRKIGDHRTKTRTIRLAVPVNLPAGIEIVDTEPDHSGPIGDGDGHE